MQKKKIEEVETWLKTHIFQRQPKQVNLLNSVTGGIKPCKRAGWNFKFREKPQLREIVTVCLVHCRRYSKSRLELVRLFWAYAPKRWILVLLRNTVFWHPVVNHNSSVSA